MHLRAPAKVNLGLVVGAKRPDGFHELVTKFATIGLCDDLVIAIDDDSSSGVSLEITGNEDLAADAIEANLCVRAARLFLAEIGAGLSVRMQLTKRIPTGAGLGGGSSDAAAVFRAMSSLTGSPIGDERLAELAASLGSDVPFFLTGGVALGRGRGEIIEPIEETLVDGILLVKPTASVPTAKAYGLLAESRTSGRDLADLSIALDEASLHNDFQEPIAAAFPSIAGLLDRLNVLVGPDRCAMSGSGAACFGLFNNPASANEAAALFADVPFVWRGGFVGR